MGQGESALAIPFLCRESRPVLAMASAMLYLAVDTVGCSTRQGRFTLYRPHHTVLRNVARNIAKHAVRTSLCPNLPYPITIVSNTHTHSPPPRTAVRSPGSSHGTIISHPYAQAGPC